jgi:hypothetical protein
VTKITDNLIAYKNTAFGGGYTFEGQAYQLINSVYLDVPPTKEIP